MSTASHFADFLQQIGHQVVPVKNLYVYNKQKIAWLAFPYHLTMHHGPEVDAVMRSHKRMILLRYCEPADGAGIDGHRLVCRDKGYDLIKLSANTRSHTRRGLRNCTIEQANPSDFRLSGFELFHSTRARQQRPLDSTARKTWERYCDSADQIPGFSAWGAWNDNKLAALMIGFQMDGCFNILRQASSTEHLKAYPNNALVYTATQQLMTRLEVTEISYGLSPLSQPVHTLDQFKAQMGYIPVPARQNVLLTPRFRAMAPAARQVISTLRHVTPMNEQLAQAEAMLSVATRRR